MTEQLQQALVDAVNKAVLATEKGGEFVVNQAPEIIQQFLAWKLVEHSFWATISLLIFLIFAWLTVKIHKHIWNLDWDYVPHYLNYLFVIPIIPAFFVGINHLLWALMVWFAPKVFLLEWAASQIKGS